MTNAQDTFRVWSVRQTFSVLFFFCMSFRLSPREWNSFLVRSVFTVLNVGVYFIHLWYLDPFETNSFTFSAYISGIGILETKFGTIIGKINHPFTTQSKLCSRSITETNHFVTRKLETRTEHRSDRRDRKRVFRKETRGESWGERGEGWNFRERR